MTIEFYDRRSGQWVHQTESLDMSGLYESFLPLVQPRGRILDAGCGPGRDARAFLDRGFRVLAIDASERMVELATARLGRPAKLLRFQEIDFEEEFDGIWACASLLHVPSRELPDVFARLHRALAPGGAWYMSFKLGSGERNQDGRLFCDQTEKTLHALIDPLPDSVIHRMWRTEDVRPDRRQQDWINCIATRGAGD